MFSWLSLAPVVSLGNISADGFSEGLKRFKSSEERCGAAASTLLAPLFSFSKGQQTASPRSETFLCGGTPGSSPCLQTGRPTWNQRSSLGWCEWQQSPDSGRAARARGDSNTRRRWGDPWGFTEITVWTGTASHRTHLRFRTKTSHDHRQGSTILSWVSTHSGALTRSLRMKSTASSDTLAKASLL